MAGPERLFRELQRRRVFRVAFVYAAVAFIIWQAAEIAVPALNLPQWFLTFIVLVTLLGFPIALVLAWAFDVTAAGVRRAEPRELAEEKGRRVPGWLRLAEAAALFIAGTLLLIWSPWDRRDPLVAIAHLTFVDSVAVFPIVDRSDEGNMAQLSAGITEEIVGHLRRVGTIKISDPFSVQRLQELNISARQIADSLGVQKLIFGSVFGSESGVQFRVRVSDVRSGTVLSTERYSDDPSDRLKAAIRLADAFVDDYLGDSGIRAAMLEGPNPQGTGYESYLVGKTWLARRTPEGLARAGVAFEEALERNPGYAFAYAGLASTYALFDTYRYRAGADGYRTVGWRWPSLIARSSWSRDSPMAIPRAY